MEQIAVIAASNVGAWRPRNVWALDISSVHAVHASCFAPLALLFFFDRLGARMGISHALVKCVPSTCVPA